MHRGNPTQLHCNPLQSCRNLVTVTKNSGLTLYKGASGGTFPTPGIPIFRHPRLLAPLAMTAGDIDRDGDLDLWITQYKPSYVGGIESQIEVVDQAL